MSTASRRRFLALGLGGLALPALLGAQQPPTPGTTPPDQLYDPNSLERRDAIVEETANDATVNAAEHRLACPCPCTLDVFTCRTTDFTCTFSPERHKEVVALVEQGMTEDQVLETMVRTYGEEALMAPTPKGFNLVGYVLPASVILSLGAVIVAVLALRQRSEQVAAAHVAVAAGRDAVSAEDAARIDRELRELES